MAKNFQRTHEINYQKASCFKINKQKPTAFLYNINKQLETNLRK